MEKKSLIEAEKIHLFHLEVQEFDIDTQGLKKSKKHKLGIGHRLLHNLEKKRLKLDINIYLNSDDQQELLSLKVDYHFQIENLPDFYILNDKDQPRFDGNMIATLLGIAVSTSRGILFEKLAAQGVDPVIIPVVSPVKLLQGE